MAKEASCYLGELKRKKKSSLTINKDVSKDDMDCIMRISDIYIYFTANKCSAWHKEGQIDYSEGYNFISKE